jgi:hypothetical protein
MEKIMNFWGKYYAVVLAFFSFLFSVTLWFSGFKLEGIFVGIWVPSILGFYTVIKLINDK